jgi:4-hydroxybutyrate CoA-transferase
MTLESYKTRIYPPNFLESYKRKLVSADEAAKQIKSGDKILVHSNCAFPSALIEAMVRRKDELRDVEILHALAVGDLPYLEPGLENSFRHNAFFLGHSSRKAVYDGRADFSTIHLSQIPLLFSKGIIKLDIAMLHVSPPDEHGFCSLGLEVGLTKTGAEKAKIIIAQVNKNVPRVLGDSFIHMSKIHFFVEADEPLKELPQATKAQEPEMAAIYEKIGENVASLIEDGATLQLGIGAIPDSVLKFLSNHRDLGVHTEMFSDGVIELIERGIITNEKKSIHIGKAVAGFVLGTNRLYQYINNNPLFEFHPQEYVNDPFVVARNSKMTAVNSAIEVDITGQVCSDSIGTRFYSGFGGQLDFIRGAGRSEGGKPIIALPSTTKDKKFSKIVAQLKPGAGVVTTRADVHYVVTEFGVAYLYGKPVRERIKLLIDIAHPNFREELYNYAVEHRYV